MVSRPYFRNVLKKIANPSLLQLAILLPALPGLAIVWMTAWALYVIGDRVRIRRARLQVYINQSMKPEVNLQEARHRLALKDGQTENSVKEWSA